MKFTNLLSEPFKYMIKLDADDGAEAGNNGSGNAGESGDQSGNDNSNNDDGDDTDSDEGDSDDDDQSDDIQKKIDAAINGRLAQVNRQHARTIEQMQATHKAELEKLQRAQRRAGMSAEDAEDDELQERLDEIARREDELATREREGYALSSLAKQSLPVTDEFVQLVVGSTDDITDANITIIKSTIVAEAKRYMKDKLRSKNSPAGSATSTSANATDSIGAQIAKERAEQKKNKPEEFDPWATN